MPEIPVKAVKKALDLLSALNFEDPEQRGSRLTELAQRLGLPSNTTHNLLKTMAACGYVGQNEAGRYLPGPQCRRIGLLNKVEGRNFRQKLADVLKRYCAKVDEAMVFAVLHGGRRVLIASSDPAGQAIRVDRNAFENRSIYSLPTGRVLASFSSLAGFGRIRKIYGEPEKSWPGFEADMERIRKNGYCLMLPDSSGVNSFAFPVRDAGGRLLGAIGCYAPAFRSGPEARKKIMTFLRQAADEISGL